MESHADDDGAIEGGVGVAVAASIEAVPAGGHPGRGRDRARAAELRERGFRTNPVGIIAEDDQQFGRGVGAHTEALAEGRCCLGCEAREVLVVYRNFLGESDPAAGKRCFRHQLLLPRPYLVLTKPLRLDIQCQRGASVKIGWKYLDD